MKVVATICSKKKDEREGNLPAYLRYLAPHIQEAYKKSQELGVPLFILSGKYGLISGEEKIPNYDYYLEEGKSAELGVTIGEQLKKEGVTEIDFLMEPKDSWKPYVSALEKGVWLAGCVLHKELLSPPISEPKMR